MSSSASDRQPDRANSASVSSETVSASSSPPDPIVLEQVLRETLADGTTGALDPADLDALREVARRYRGEPMVLDPVVVDLVDAILRRQFRNMADTYEAWGAMTSRIAETLFDDPVSRDRLELFWGRLAGTTR